MTAAEIKQYLNKHVRYRDDKTGVDMIGILSGAIFRKKDNVFYYQAEIQSTNGSRSITICSLESISPANKIGGAP